MPNANLETAIDILRRLHMQVPSKTKEQQRIKSNLFCALVYLEDGINELKESL